MVVDLQLPAGTTLESLPSGATLETGVGRWMTTWSRTGNGVRFERVLETPWAELPARDYPHVRKFFDGLGQADEEVLVVRKP